MSGRFRALLLAVAVSGCFGQLTGTTFTLSQDGLTKLDFNYFSGFGSSATIVNRAPSGGGVEFTLAFASNAFPSDTIYPTSHHTEGAGALAGLNIAAYDQFALRFTLLAINNQQPPSMGVVVGSVVSSAASTPIATDNRPLNFGSPTTTSSTLSNASTVDFIGFLLSVTGLPASGGTVRVLVEPAAGAVQLPAGPVTDSIYPFAGTATDQTFTVVYTNPNGWNNIANGYLVFGNTNLTLDKTDSCYMQYNAAANAIRLYNDAGTAWLGPSVLGSGLNLENSRCRVHASTASSTRSGDRVTLQLPLTFKPGFSGEKNIYMATEEMSGFVSPWITVGGWWPGEPNGVPVNRYRLFNPHSRSHLHTTDLNEYNVLGTRGFQQEGISGRVYNTPATVGGVAATPLYRIYIVPSLRHFWTADRNEYLTLQRWHPTVYRGEGIDGFVFPNQVTGTIPLYRLVFNYEVIHHWTPDLNEYNVLGNSGHWRQEGVAAYILPPP